MLSNLVIKKPYMHACAAAVEFHSRPDGDAKVCVCGRLHPRAQARGGGVRGVVERRQEEGRARVREGWLKGGRRKEGRGCARGG